MEFSKSPQPSRIKWSTRIDTRRREGWRKGETEGRVKRGLGGEVCCKWTGDIRSCNFIPTSSTEAEVAGRGLRQVRNPSIQFVPGITVPFSPQNPWTRPEWRLTAARARHSTHVKRSREKRESLFTRNLPVNFILYIEFLEQNSSLEKRFLVSIPRLPLSRDLSVFILILFSAFGKEMISRNLSITLHF